jgi:hypothetical protein
VDGFLWDFMWKKKFDRELWDRLLLCMKNIRYDGEPVYEPPEVPQLIGQPEGGAVDGPHDD